ncbi:MAG TPA: hypothetical protein PKC89_06925 [Pyrinomonadaceae bacterium]|nr:hypothetical protein [Pyrinomonadaceae bacterium]
MAFASNYVLFGRSFTQWTPVSFKDLISEGDQTSELYIFEPSTFG